MALVRDIIFKRFPVQGRAVFLERRNLNLKGVKRVTFHFDPFRSDSADIRKCANLMYAKVTLKSNPKCVVRTEILRDRSDHYIDFELLDGKAITFKCPNLKLLEIYQLMNKYITPLAPKEDQDAGTLLKKIEKKK